MTANDTAAREAAMFSSRRPFNRDPKPFIHLAGGGRTSSPVGGTGYFRNIYDPREKYGRPQNNSTNPVLTAFRRQIAMQEDEGGFTGLAAEANYWLDMDEDEGVDRGGVTPAHIDHARKVLARLASRS